MATTCPLEDRALLWAGLLDKAQRETLHPYRRQLPLRHSRTLLLGIGRSFARSTRTLWECYRQQLTSISSLHDPPDEFTSHNNMTFSQVL